FAVEAGAITPPAAIGIPPVDYWKDQLNRLDHPVVSIKWSDALAYAQWFASITHEPWRLATEAEWEKAARGTAGNIYPWGNQWDRSRANTSDGGPGRTTPVGSYRDGASPYGVQDMAGNAFQWTSTLYQAYPYSANDGRENLTGQGKRVIRGGSYFDPPPLARSAYRDGFVGDPGYIANSVGFRL